MARQKNPAQLIQLGNVSLDGALDALDAGDATRAAGLVMRAISFVSIPRVLDDRARFGNARAFVGRLNKALCVIASGREFPLRLRVEAVNHLATTWQGGVCRTLLRLSSDRRAPAEVRQAARTVVLDQAEPVENAPSAADINALN
jgi:hypothetical protein